MSYPQSAGTNAIADGLFIPDQARSEVVIESQTSAREIEIDVLRGWCMVTIILMHISISSRLTAIAYFHRYIVAASGFVFLAGLMLGQISRPRIEREGAHTTYRKTGQRVFKLWVVHCLFMFAVIALHETTGILPKLPDVSEVGGWAQAFWMVPLLRLQSEYYLNILPLYIVFLSLTPLVLEALHRRMTAIVLTVSITLYAASQYATELFPLAHPASGAQVFSLSAWQLIFFGGLVLGWHRKTLVREWWPQNRSWLIPVSFVICIGIFVVGSLQRPSLPHFHVMNDATEAFWFDRVTHAPGRLLAFASLMIPSYLFVQFCHRHQKFPGPLRWLATIGSSSLYCFIVHLVFAITFRAINTWSWPWWSQESLTVLTVIVIYHMAKYKVLARIIPN